MALGTADLPSIDLGCTQFEEMRDFVRPAQLRRAGPRSQDSKTDDTPAHQSNEPPPLHIRRCNSGLPDRG